MKSNTQLLVLNDLKRTITTTNLVMQLLLEDAYIVHILDAWYKYST